MNILLMVSGSVAATVVKKLEGELQQIGDVKVVVTTSVVNFFGESLSGVYCYTDDNEKMMYHGEGKVLHIELRKWADVCVVAPLSANTLGKIANGMCDNLLTCVTQAWDFAKPIVVAPAMNTYMLSNPTTQKNLGALESMGYVIVPPVSKVLACGDEGVGAMAHTTTIVDTVKNVTTEWVFPLKECSLVPAGEHPGSFSAIRKHDRHTGVDLYCENRAKIYSCTDGVVVDVKPFTGKQLGHDWWNETDAIVVDTGRNFIVYGECQAAVGVGDRVSRGEIIGEVKQVLPSHKLRPDILGHSCSMLHIELYRRNPKLSTTAEGIEFVTWHLKEHQPFDLLDPTLLLQLAYEHVKLM